MADVGLTFSPTSAPNDGSQKSQVGSGISPVQDAIRILSFRMPSVLGASAVTPLQNLGGPSPYGSAMGSSVIENWLRQLLMGGQGGGPSPYGSTFPPSEGAPPPMPSPNAPLPPSIVISQPRPQQPSAPSMPPSQSPFPGAQGGGGARPY